MKRAAQGVVVILILVSTLAGCGISFGQPARDVAAEFDRLARYVPANADFPVFFDLKPQGEVAERWTALLRRLGEDASSEMLLTYVLGQPQGQNSLLGPFKAEELELMDAIDGPAVAGWWDGAQYAILQVSSEREAREALIRNLGDESAWEQKEFDGRTLYNARFRGSGGVSTYLSWTVSDGLVFLSYRTNLLWFDKLEALLSLTEEGSMAADPEWQVLRDRLPEGLIAASFTSLGPVPGEPVPASIAGDPLSALPRLVEAVMLSGVPEADGVRIYLDGIVAPEAASVPEMQALFDLPAVDPGAWAALPSDTALALVTHDMATVWLWMGPLFGGDDDVEATFGIDLVSEFTAPGGPLAGTFAIAVTPPLPTQPFIGGMPAIQFLVASSETTAAQADTLEAALQGTGGTFADDSVEGVPIRRQVGLEISGYAPAYGFDDGTFYFGSSPEAIRNGVLAEREDSGLVVHPAYQVFLDALPEGAFYAGYLNVEPFLDLAQTNVMGDPTAEGSLTGMVSGLDGAGFALALTPERLDGVLYLVILE